MSLCGGDSKVLHPAMSATVLIYGRATSQAPPAAPQALAMSMGVADCVLVFCKAKGSFHVKKVP